MKDGEAHPAASVQTAEVDVGVDQDFSVTTRGAGGQGKLDVKITSPSHHPIPSKLESGTANEVHTVKYIPPEEGSYRVDISYDGNPVPGSPFTVEGVMPPDPSKVRNHCHVSTGGALSPVRNQSISLILIDW